MMQGMLDELTLLDVHDRGIPNLERVVIRVNHHVDMSSYVLMQGVANESGGAVPIKDSMFWFGNGLLEPNDWIFVYTAAGQTRTEALTGKFEPNKLVVLHWARSQTMFHAPAVVPILARIDAVLTTSPAPPQRPVAGPGMLGALARPVL